MSKRKLLIANWKMNPKLASDAVRRCARIRVVAKFGNVQVVVCPPAVFLSMLIQKTNGTKFSLGAQDAFWESEGPYTGEISPAQLASLDVSHVILGHSERRALGETDEDVRKKLTLALEYPFRTVLCIGERERDSEGAYLSFLENQIRAVLARVSRSKVKRLIIAYEPIWAVGARAKKADTPENLLEVVIFIRKVLSDMLGKQLAFSVPILYGGSVTAANAEAFLKNGGVEGLLVGRSSIDPKEFISIIKTAHRV